MRFGFWRELHVLWRGKISNLYPIMFRVHGSFGFLLLILFLFANDVSCNNSHRRHRETLNDRPVIGILAQRIGDTLPDPEMKERGYIAASYVKYVESGGGRVVPILRNFTTAQVTELFNSLNGVIFPGGDADFFTSPYYKHAETFFHLAVAANKRGDYFPIWGTCLGFQTLHVLVGGGSVISRSSAENYRWPLNFTSGARQSRLFKEATPALLKALQTEDITYNFHLNCVTPEAYKKNAHIHEFFKILSTNKDIYGKTFVSTAEAKHFPFYASQWHPEKNPFEWNPAEHISHTRHAVMATQYVSNFLIDEARKSKHSFPSHEESEKYTIYKYNPTFTGDQSHFEQVYVF